mgnify:CR=1 FL=1
MNELDRLKNKIRQCDAAILEALLERNKGIEEITLYKKRAWPSVFSERAGDGNSEMAEK